MGHKPVSINGFVATSHLPSQLSPSQHSPSQQKTTTMTLITMTITALNRCTRLPNTRVLCCIAMFVAYAFSPTTLFAQSEEQLSYKIGETDLYPSVRLEFVQNSNAFLTEADPTESTGFVISPELNWVADRRLLTLRGNYVGDYATTSESELDYADHQFSADVAAELTARKRVNGKFSLDFGHQPLGTNLTRGLDNTGAEAVTYLDTQLSGEYIYGAENARGNITAGALIRSYSYNNRSDLTSNAGYLQFRPFGIFSLRISPDTRALAELRFDQFSFEGNRSDRTDTSLLGGFSFTPTGKFGGSLKIGATLSNYSGGDDESTLISEIDLNYEPTTFSRITLNLDREIDNESANPTSADSLSVIRDAASLVWRHEWSSRVFHVARLTVRNLSRACPDSDTSTTGVGYEMNVKVRRWLTVGASANTTRRTSSDCANAVDEPDLDYERQIIGVHLKATL